MASSRPNPYLEAFPEFTPNPRASVVTEFKRLAGIKRWRPKTEDYRTQRREYLLSEYDLNLGRLERENKLENFQELCRKLGIKNVPTSITQCKKTLKTEVHVNLVTLIDDLRGVGRVRVFGSRAQLQEFTHKTRKFFPLDCAKKSDLLKVLLRELKEHR